MKDSVVSRTGFPFHRGRRRPRHQKVGRLYRLVSNRGDKNYGSATPNVTFSTNQFSASSGELDFVSWNREHSRRYRPLTGLKGNKARYGVTLAVPATVGGEQWVIEATGPRPGRQIRCVEPRARKPAGTGVASPGSGKIGTRTTTVGDAHSRLIGGVRYEDASAYAEK